MSSEMDRLAALYPFVYKWEKRMGAMDYYLIKQLEQAEIDSAPTNAIYKSGDSWQTLDDVENPNVFRDFGVEIPDRLKSTENVWGTDVSMINADEFCIWCEREVPNHYNNCPTRLVT